MKANTVAVGAAGLTALAASAAHAQPSAGVSSLAVPAQTDTRVAVPFSQQAVGEFSVAANGISASTVTLAGADFSDGRFTTNSQGSPLFYVRFTSGDLEGRWFNIDQQDGDTLTLSVEDTGDSAASALGDASEGDTLEVIPHWTIAELFPDGQEGFSFLESGNPFNPQFEILLPANGGAGVNRPTTSSLLYTDGDWVFRAGGNADDVVVEPQRTLILRNNGSLDTGEANNPATLGDESTGSLRFVPGGRVPDFEVIEQIPVRSQESDVIFSADNATATTLGQLNLQQIMTQSSNPFQPTDQLLVFPDPEPQNGLNVSAATTVLNIGGTLTTRLGENAEDIQVRPGEVFILRKAAGTPGDIDWNVGPQ